MKYQVLVDDVLHKAVEVNPLPFDFGACNRGGKRPVGVLMEDD